jgi:hypothetical protein
MKTAGTFHFGSAGAFKVRKRWTIPNINLLEHSSRASCLIIKLKGIVS